MPSNPDDPGVVQPLQPVVREGMVWRDLDHYLSYCDARRTYELVTKMLEIQIELTEISGKTKPRQEADADRAALHRRIMTDRQPLIDLMTTLMSFATAVPGNVSQAPWPGIRAVQHRERPADVLSLADWRGKNR